MINIDVKYKTQIENIGWLDFVKDGTTSGTEGQSLRLEAFIAELETDEDVQLEYQAHCQDIGWQGWVKAGEIAGTVGESRRLEAIQMRLTGNDASKYKINYRSHVENNAWMDWCCDGESSGTEGGSLRVEAIEVKITESDVDLKVDTVVSFLKKESAPTVTIPLGLVSGEKGIDVSYFQGYDIDWSAVAGDGYTFAICRALESYDPDSTYANNIPRARAAGIKVGVYQLTRATSADEAISEANALISRLQEVGGDFPAGVYCDLEIPGTEETSSEVIDAFCNTIHNAGYPTGYYCGYYWNRDYVNDDVKNKWHFWLSQYNDTQDMPAYIWQHSSSGSVSGIPGNCDLDIVC